MKSFAKFLLLSSYMGLATSLHAANAPLPEGMRISNLFSEKKGLFATVFALDDALPFYRDSIGLFRSDDSGKTWVLLRSLQGYTQMTENDDFLYLGHQNSILRSSDSGMTWTQIYPATGARGGGVEALATLGSVLLVATDSIGVVRSPDNGDHWLDSPESINSSSIYELATNGTNIFATLELSVWRSEDSGKTWSLATTSSNPFNVANLHSIGNALVAFGYQDTSFYRSTDSGKSWQEGHTGLVFPPTSSGPPLEEFAVGENAMFANNIQGIFRSLDHGLSWDLYMYTPDRIYAMGIVGNYLVLSSSSGLAIYDVNITPPSAITPPSRDKRGFGIKQNLTMRNGLGRLDFSLPKADQVQINLYNLHGEKLQTLVKGQYSGGLHKVEFHAKSLARGIYFLRLQAGGAIETRAFQLLP